MTQWVKVEFYGQVPDGQAVMNVDVPVVANQLMHAFGFTHIDGLTMLAAGGDVEHPAPILGVDR